MIDLTKQNVYSYKLYLVCILLGISPASDCSLPTFRNPLSVPSSRAGCTLHPALEDGTDRGFQNVGKLQSDTGEIPKRIHTIFKTRQKSEIKLYLACNKPVDLFIPCVSNATEFVALTSCRVWSWWWLGETYSSSRWR